MQLSTDRLHVSEEKTQPLTTISSLNFKIYMERYALIIRDVAQASGVRLLIVWNILHGNSISQEDARKIRTGLFLLTGERYYEYISVRASFTPSNTTEYRSLQSRYMYM